MWNSGAYPCSAWQKRAFGPMGIGYYDLWHRENPLYSYIIECHVEYKRAQDGLRVRWSLRVPHESGIRSRRGWQEEGYRIDRAFLYKSSRVV